MPASAPDPVFDAFLAASERQAFATALDTDGLRQLEAWVRYDAAFCARGTSMVFAQEIKDVIDDYTGDRISQSQAIARLAGKLRALGYDAEAGGYPDSPVAPAVRGTLRDIASYQRLKLIVDTQMGLMSGRGEKMRGETPEMLREFPAWELTRKLPVGDHRKDWYARWTIAGGTLYGKERNVIDLYAGTGMISAKGDPVWGELGTSDNFSDALDVDHPPFYFNSGMGWRPVSAARCRALGVTGPEGMPLDEWLASRPQTMGGPMPLPAPQMGVKNISPDMAKAMAKDLGAAVQDGKMVVPKTADGDVDYSDLLEKFKARREAARAARKEAAP